MIYTKLTLLAMKTAYMAHDGMTDKAGMPYIFHPMHLAEQMDSEYAAAAALLHDVAEDTGITVDGLSEIGFPAEVTDALRLLRHDSSVPYAEYIRKLKCDPIARAVKLADLRHNSDLTRLAGQSGNAGPGAAERLKKYEQALAILTDA